MTANGFGKVQAVSGNVQNSDRHAVFGQGSCFIGANDCYRAKRFNCRQLADERAPFQHALGAQGQCNGNHGSQTFGNGCNGHADGGLEHEADFFAANDP